MHAAVIPIDRRSGEYALLELALPGRPVHTVGVLLLDTAGGRLYWRLRSAWEGLADAEDIEILSALEQDFETRVAEMGGAGFLASLEDCLSNALRLTARERVPVDSFLRVRDKLFARHVEPLQPAPFRTHLPLYSLRAAAGRFSEEQSVEPEDWVPAPPALRLHEGLFAAHVQGRSMEPRIPDGSLNVFRAPVVGSRQGRIVLVELLGVHDDAARYTVKRYTSRKLERGGEWRHQSIRLEPLNPEYDPIELGEDRLRVVAEWVAVLE